jgi:hypothetical protein
LTEPASLSISKKSRAFEQPYISVAELSVRWSFSRSIIHHGQFDSDALTPRDSEKLFDSFAAKFKRLRRLLLKREANTYGEQL